MADSVNLHSMLKGVGHGRLLALKDEKQLSAFSDQPSLQKTAY